MELNEKLKAAAHYIIATTEDPLELGAIRLNKILWFCDSQAYRLWGRTITEGIYVKRQFGPVPKHILKVLSDLEADKKISLGWEQKSRYHMIKEYTSLIEPATNVLSRDDTDMLDAIRKVVLGHTAMEISEISHDAAWEVAEMGEEIPIEATLASRLSEASEEESHLSYS